MPDNGNRPVRRSRHALLSLLASTLAVTEGELSEAADFESLASWDSAREVELTMMLEFEYGITVDDEQSAKLRSVRDVRELLAANGITEA